MRPSSLLAVSTAKAISTLPSYWTSRGQTEQQPDSALHQTSKLHQGVAMPSIMVNCRTCTLHKSSLDISDPMGKSIATMMSSSRILSPYCKTARSAVEEVLGRSRGAMGESGDAVLGEGEYCESSIKFHFSPTSDPPPWRLSSSDDILQCMLCCMNPTPTGVPRPLCTCLYQFTAHHLMNVVFDCAASLRSFPFAT